MSWHHKWSGRVEASNPGLLIRMLLEFAIQLAKLIVSTIKWAEENQFGRIRG
jgi:hypothetical protein